ncbi:MAG: polysaccharide deacetylase family protein [Chloroflexota bacterium]
MTAVLLLSACAPVSTPQPTPDMEAAITQAVATIYAGGTQTALFVPPTAISTKTPIPQPTVVRTPPALPASYVSTLLNPLDTPHAYIQDTCQALKSKWDPNNAQPGTVVMVIMIHGIAKGDAAKSQDISTADFKKLMNDLKDQGFTAIFTQQLYDFLDHNAKIPDRSVLLIQDDRHTAQNFNEIFRPYWEKWQWPVVNAWNNTNDSITKTYLPENAALAKEGWVDYQSHGIIHNINMNDNSTDEFLKGELKGSMDAITANFYKAPIAIIWPGGDFGKKPVEAARSYGYKLGFTINPRGPLMFNWVPLADAGDPMRPSYIPDGSIADPLMTLPRYWDTDARSHLDTVRKIGNEARAYAEKNKAVELEYYDIICAPTYGALP